MFPRTRRYLLPSAIYIRNAVAKQMLAWKF